MLTISRITSYLFNLFAKLVLHLNMPIHLQLRLFDNIKTISSKSATNTTYCFQGKPKLDKLPLIPNNPYLTFFEVTWIGYQSVQYKRKVKPEN